MSKTSIATTGTTNAITFSVEIAAALMCGIDGLIVATGRRDVRFKWGLVMTAAIFIMQYPFTLSLVVSRPMTAVAMVKDRVRMGCTRDWSNSSVDWEFAPADTNDTSFIYTNRQIVTNLTSRYKIDTDNKTRYDLVIDTVDSSYAGTYICSPITPEELTPQSGSAQLVVLESDPVCNTNENASTGGIVEGDYLKLWCTVNYTGNWIPIMDWNMTSSAKRQLDFQETFEKNMATSSITISLYSADDGVAIACLTSFNSDNHKNVRNPRPGEILAANQPDYQSVWTFKLSVLYSARDLTITPRKSVYAVGDRLVCSAKGNPTPTYEWMDVKTNKTINGSVLTISDQMKSVQNHVFRCTAYNTVKGVGKQIAETVTFTVTAASVTRHSSKASSTAFSATQVIAEIALGFALMLSMKAKN